MSRTIARLILAALVCVFAWSLWSSSPDSDIPPRPAGSGDAAFFMSVIERLAGGDEYYATFGDELRRNGYPAASLFNWRTPLHLTLVATTSPAFASLLLKALVLAALFATAVVLSKFGGPTAVVGTTLQMGALASAFQPEAVGISEIVAGVLVALSACAYYRQYQVAGALTGIAAVFVRELAVPYGLACGVLAIGARRKREAVTWVVAGVVYGTYYVAHAWLVQAHQLPGDLAHAESWHRWNGLRFTLATIGVNGWLQFMPRWAAALVLVGGLAGTLARGTPPQIKVALLTYVALFAFVGLPFNSYWGFVSAPLWAFGVAHAAGGLRRTAAAAR